MAATDFFAVEVCTLRGLVTHYVLSFVGLASRGVRIGGVTTHPDDPWMMQIARNLTDSEETFLQGIRASDYGSGYKVHGGLQGSACARGGQGDPPPTAESECFCGAICAHNQGGCVDRMIFLGRSSLERALGSILCITTLSAITMELATGCCAAPLACPPLRARRRRERLGGMLSFYYREAA
jgi:hypothetical protein